MGTPLLLNIGFSVFASGKHRSCVHAADLYFSLLEQKTISYLPVGHLRDVSISAGKALLTHAGCLAEGPPAQHCAFTALQPFHLKPFRLNFKVDFKLDHLKMNFYVQSDVSTVLFGLYKMGV